jgi:hypothetical protein
MEVGWRRLGLRFACCTHRGWDQDAGRGNGQEHRRRQRCGWQAPVQGPLCRDWTRVQRLHAAGGWPDSHLLGVGPRHEGRQGREGDEITANEVWNNKDNSVQFSSPVVKDGLVYGITAADKLFCVNTKDSKTAWTASGGGKGGYGSVVDVGPVLLALTPSSQLIVFEPSDKEFKQLAKYKVGAECFAYPIVAGNRLFVKDKDSVALWIIE